MFEAAQKAAKTEGDKVAIVTEGNLKIVKITPENDGEPIYLSVADKETIVGGSSTKLVVSALKAAEAKGKPMIKGDLAKLVIDQDAKSSMYFCSLVEGKIPTTATRRWANPERRSTRIAKATRSDEEHRRDASCQ